MANYQEIKLDVTVKGSPMAIGGKFMQRVIAEAVKKECGVYEVEVVVTKDNYVTEKPKQHEDSTTA